jgi:sensor domain CHASE-containing protein
VTSARRNALLALTALTTAGVLSVTVILLKDHVTTLYSLQAATATDKMKASLQEAVDGHVDGLSDLAKNLEAAPPANTDDYRELAVQTTVRAPAFVGVNYVDHKFTERFLFPYGPNRSLEGMDIKTRSDALPAAHRALTSRRPGATDLVPLAQGGEGFLTYTPVYRQERWEGFVEGALDRDNFAGRYVAPATPPEHDVSLLAESSPRPFFRTGQDAPAGPYDFYFTLKFADRRWWVVLHPRQAPSVLTPLLLTMLAELALGAFLALRILKRERG